ncbi:hypothetical protein BDZ97DRAFT_1755217 [Flammula alnicola]|nr:hypothetical protein BDZ97DRAFT_1755217 [Flammula alnicola]
MAPLSTFPLPLPTNGPPTGYGWEGSDHSLLSTTTAFNTRIDQRDKFLGLPRCIICGMRRGLQYCHIASNQSRKFIHRKQTRKFVFVNYSGSLDLQLFHGKAIALDTSDRHAPFPSLFIIHEMRVRGFHPFKPVAPAIPDDIPWQDWILSPNILKNAAGLFNRDRLPRNSNNNISAQPQQPMTTSVVGASSGGRTLEPNADVIADILAATRFLPLCRRA